MKMPEIERLHAEAIHRLKEMAAGRGPSSFGALMEGARYMAISEMCAALRKDLRTEMHDNALKQPAPSETNVNESATNGA